MNCCCKTIYKFCDPVIPCDETTFAKMLSSLADGAYTVELEFLIFIKRIDLVKTGNEIEFAKPFQLNENFTYTAKLRDGDNERVPFYFASVPYDCFEFHTKLSKNA